MCSLQPLLVCMHGRQSSHRQYNLSALVRRFRVYISTVASKDIYLINGIWNQSTPTYSWLLNEFIEWTRQHAFSFASLLGIGHVWACCLFLVVHFFCPKRSTFPRCFPLRCGRHSSLFDAHIRTCKGQTDENHSPVELNKSVDVQFAKIVHTLI